MRLGFTLAFSWGSALLGGLLCLFLASCSSSRFSSKFDYSFSKLIAKEGGYVSNPVDPGGETKFGISRKAYPSIDIKSITLEQAKRIYYEDYWRKAKIHRVLNWDVASKLLDIVVNFGENQAKEIIQRSLMSVHRRPRMGLEGKWSRLVELVNGVSNNEALLAALRSEQAAVYRMIVQKKEPLNIFLDGWLIRAYS